MLHPELFTEEQERNALADDPRRPLHRGGWEATGNAVLEGGQTWIEERWTGEDLMQEPYYQTGETRWTLHPSNNHS